MPQINNINLDKVSATVESIKRDPTKAKVVSRVEGEWLFDGETQFRAVLPTEQGSQTLEMSLPSFLGGTGKMPGPIQYCLFGLASCFASTIASIAAEKNIRLKRARVSAECSLDFSKTLGLNDKPIVEGIRFIVDIEADADDSMVKQILAEA